MTRCYLGLGSNLRSPERQLRQAIKLLHKIPRSVVTQMSTTYLSRPLGVRSQPQYCNMVLEIETSLSANHVLHYCQRIENQLKRRRKKHWGARTIDIDLLLYGKCTINQQHLKVPHPEMIHRDFVLVPLLEIAPKAQLPNGASLDLYIKQCVNYIIGNEG